MKILLIYILPLVETQASDKVINNVYKINCRYCVGKYKYFFFSNLKYNTQKAYNIQIHNLLNQTIHMTDSYDSLESLFNTDTEQKFTKISQLLWKGDFIKSFLLGVAK